MLDNESAKGRLGKGSEYKELMNYSKKKSHSDLQDRVDKMLKNKDLEEYDYLNRSEILKRKAEKNLKDSKKKNK